MSSFINVLTFSSFLPRCFALSAMYKPLCTLCHQRTFTPVGNRCITSCIGVLQRGPHFVYVTNWRQMQILEVVWQEDARNSMCNQWTPKAIAGHSRLKELWNGTSCPVIWEGWDQLLHSGTYWRSTCSTLTFQSLYKTCFLFLISFCNFVLGFLCVLWSYVVGICLLFICCSFGVVLCGGYTGLPGRPAHGWWDIPVKN